MSLVTQLQDVVTRIATESKSLRTLLNGNAADNSALVTTAKNNLVAAINEVAGLSGGPIALEDLTDVDATLAGILLATTASFTTAKDSKLTGIATGADVTSATNIASIIHAATAKTTPVSADEFALIDSAASNVLKRMTWSNLLAAITAAIVDSAPGTLDTLNELAAALGDDPNFSATITALIATKQDGDATLTALAGLTVANNKGIYATGADAFATYDLTAYGRTIGGFADAPAARTSIDVYSKTEIGDPTTNFVTTFEAGLV